MSSIQKTPRILAFVAAILLSLIVTANAFKEGPYPNVTGGFGEQSCRLCHLDNPVNAPGGSLTLDGVPATFTPGAVYSITVTIAREDMRRGGFEIAARFASGKQKGRQAGTWKLTDARTQLIPGAVDKALTFVQHNLAGSRTATAGANSWTIEWTAPTDAPGPVQFNVAANASNNDDSPLGDYIYLKAARSLPARLKDTPPHKLRATGTPSRRAPSP
jgi:Reeler domain-containing protein